MKEIALNTQTTQHTQTMTSLEIAELTGKQHKHVMEAIRKMEPAWVNIAGSNFRLGSYKDLNGQLRPCYQLTKTECLYIATKFNDEARAKLVLRHGHPVSTR
jgi:phage regulator Rha-like protein